jgi:hypothetical protein
MKITHILVGIVTIKLGKDYKTCGCDGATITAPPPLALSSPGSSPSSALPRTRLCLSPGDDARAPSAAAHCGRWRRRHGSACFSEVHLLPIFLSFPHSHISLSPPSLRWAEGGWRGQRHPHQQPGLWTRRRRVRVKVWGCRGRGF